MGLFIWCIFNPDPKYFNQTPNILVTLYIKLNNQAINSLLENKKIKRKTRLASPIHITYCWSLWLTTPFSCRKCCARNGFSGKVKWGVCVCVNEKSYRKLKFLPFGKDLFYRKVLPSRKIEVLGLTTFLVFEHIHIKLQEICFFLSFSSFPCD